MRHKTDKPDPSEHQIQSAFMEWVAFKAIEDEAYSTFFHVPNEEASKTQRFIKAKAGVKAGVPDNICIEPRGKYKGLVIEMKKRGGRLSKSQKKWLTYFAKRGWAVFVCKSFDGAKRVTEMYMGL